MSDHMDGLMERLKEWCLAKQAELRQGVEAFETSSRRSYLNNVDTTVQTEERERAELASLDQILAEWPTTRP